MDYASRLINPSIGYMVFWMYWLSWVLTVAVGYIAIGLLMQRWFLGIPVYVWVIACIVLLFLLNFFSVKIFATGEFLLSAIEVLAVFVFIMLGSVGIIYSFYLHGFEGVFANFYFSGEVQWLEKGFFLKGVGAILAVIFACMGTEIIGVAARRD